MKMDVYQPLGKRRLFSFWACEQIQSWVLSHALLQAFKKRRTKSIIETYSTHDLTNSDTTPNRWQFGCWAPSTSLAEVPNYPEPRSREIPPPIKFDQVVSKFTEGRAEGIFLYLNKSALPLRHPPEIKSFAAALTAEAIVGSSLTGREGKGNILLPCGKLY